MARPFVADVLRTDNELGGFYYVDPRIKAAK